MSAPGKGRGAKPSPVVAPATPVSSRPSSAVAGSGDKASPPKQTTPAPGTTPTPDKVIPISSDPTEEGREDGTAGGAEADSELREMDLDNLVRATRGQASASSA